ncbi:MAG: phosphoglycerate kinase [Peptococcaceae bacterium]|jgi:phosphoglycerate kinase|nr:phosphoglycerate kinase [Peptococcaceae bacterium]
MEKKSVRDIDVAGKTILMRVDFNVPLDEKGNITNDSRIQGAIPTITYLVEQGAKVVLASHLGRPKGKFVDSMSLKPVAVRLGEILQKEVLFIPACIGEDVTSAVKGLKAGDVAMLENVRFYPEEEANDAAFAEALASLADIYVNDAFGTVHRAHASISGVTKYLPSVCGFLLEKEVNTLARALEQPQKPFIAIVGGSKVSDKIGVIKNLLHKVDYLLIGGGMANTFLAAKGHDMQKSLVEEAMLDWTKELLGESNADKILLPVDVVAAERFAADSDSRTVSCDQVPDGWMVLDIGPKTVAAYGEKIAAAKTVIWNGPMGVFEMEQFAAGTRGVAQAVCDSDCMSIIGGGDSVAAITQMGLIDKVSHASTGGGASLKMLEGQELPGVVGLEEK